VPLTFLVGGARSGKSALAVELAASHRRPVTFVATAEARDDDMAARISRHRRSRPSGWTTVEAPLRLADVVSGLGDEACVVVDCLTLWTSNVLEAGVTEDAILDEASAIGVALSARPAPSIVVSNEVGSGIVPMKELARRYRDVLGRVNTAVASSADPSYLVVAGRALRLERLV
jgi:adenosyl cobinamide kinase/adenosyl cobinamide phosphate guanylyltransferase